MHSLQRAVLVAATVSGILAVSQSLQAATNFTWLGGSGDWTTTTNYSPNGTPSGANGDDVIFSTGGVNPSAGDVSAKFMEFDGPSAQSYSLGGNSITIATSGNIDMWTSDADQAVSPTTLTFSGSGAVRGTGGSTNTLTISPGTLSMSSGIIQSVTGPFVIAPTSTGALGTGTITAGGTGGTSAASIAINGGDITRPSGSIVANLAPITIGSNSFTIATTGAATMQANTGSSITASTPISLGVATQKLTLTGAGTIALNGGLAGAASNSSNPVTVTSATTGSVTLGSSGSWGGDIQLGTSKTTSYGNIIVTANDSLGDSGNASSGYTDLGLSAAGAIVANSGGSLSIGEYIYMRGRSAVNPQIINQAGNNTFTGSITAETSGGGTNLAFRSDAGSLTFSGTIDLTAALSETLSLLGTASGTISGPITQSGGGQIGIVKSDSGTWTIAGAQSYSGTTLVTDGKLVVNAVHTGGGGYTVGGGATLGGSGTISAAVDLNGAIAPGNSAGTLTVGGLTLENSSSAAMELQNTNGLHAPGGGLSDLISVTGVLQIAAGNPTITINASAVGGGLLGTGAGVSTWTLATYASSSILSTPTFVINGIAPGYTPTIDLNTPNQVNLVLTAVPEPSTFVLLGLGLAGLGLVRIKRRK